MSNTSSPSFVLFDWRMERVKKATTSLFLIIIVLSSSIVIRATSFCFAQTQGTSVIGIINSNTIWSTSNSPYNFTGPVAINSGVTLTIEQGATVNIGAWYLQVNGTLTAKGTSNNPITITATGSLAWADDETPFTKILFNPSSSSWNQQTETGSIIQNAVLNCIPVVTKNASPKIDGNTILLNNSNIFSAAVLVDGGSPLILNNSISMKGNGFQGTGVFVWSGSPNISNNTITGLGCMIGSGIGSIGNAYIYGNSISGWQNGIYAYNDTIISNLVYLNNPMDSNLGQTLGSIGLALGGNGSVLNNTIINNQIGLYVSQPTATILNNNIYGNQENMAISTANINATNNWWGTTDIPGINQTILDFKNDFNRGNVTFIPFLEKPNPSAPIDASSRDFIQIDFNHDGKVDFADIVYFVDAYINFNQHGVLNPACDLNQDGKLDFSDITLFVNAYIAYAKSLATNSG